LRRLRTATRDGVDLFPIPGTERKQAGPSAGSIEPPWRHVAPGRPRTDLHGGGVLAKMCALAVRMPPDHRRARMLTRGCRNRSKAAPKAARTGRFHRKSPLFAHDGAP